MEQEPGNTADMAPPIDFSAASAARKEAFKKAASPFLAALSRIGDTEDGRLVAAVLRTRIQQTSVAIVQGGMMQIPDDRVLLFKEGEKHALLGILLGGLDQQIAKDFGL
jgi:hypothetical protein